MDLPSRAWRQQEAEAQAAAFAHSAPPVAPTQDEDDLSGVEPLGGDEGMCSWYRIVSWDWSS